MFLIAFSFTGHGVEKLITAVQRLWQSKHDVYLIGEVNVGKSSLFNMLLESDFSKGQMIDYFQVSGRISSRNGIYS